MLLTAAAMWLNLTPENRDLSIDMDNVLKAERGWPVVFQRWIEQAQHVRTEIFYEALVFDCAIYAVGLIWVAVIMEWLIRRRKLR